MRHGNKINHLGRKTAHRKALLMNMSNSLILHKRITTTVAKAKEFRKHIEPLLNKTKSDTTHNRRILFSYLQDKESIKELFGVIAEKIADRPGGYTRIIKLGFRAGDAAEMAMIELVDFNYVYVKEAKANAGKTRRGKRKATSSSVAAPVVEEAEVVEEATVVEEPTITEENATEVVEENVAESTEEAQAETETSEETKTEE